MRECQEETGVLAEIVLPLGSFKATSRVTQPACTV
ncbi:MAG: hypothetical protein H6774_00335 [Pseudomonadales bacterium]|nr:hypothetical protein [Pseudomonadales bacterium]